MALTATLANQLHLFQPIRAQVQAQLDLGIVTRDEKATIITARSSGLLSHMSRTPALPVAACSPTPKS